MGRKIPGRKHHGVRDPAKQQLERLKKVKDKINAPPSNPDDQQLPKSLQRIMELKEKTKSGVFAQKKRKKNAFMKFKQSPHESDNQFLWRVQQHCNMVKHEATFAEKFGVDIQRNKRGEIEGVKKRPKDPITVMIKEERDNKKKKKTEAPKLTKSQKRNLKLKERKKKKLNSKEVDGFKELKDHVEFGEQIHGPPSLTLPRNAKKRDERPGKKDLVLKTILNKSIDKKVKRKDLPHALRRQLDKQQTEIIQAYRELKGQKYKVNE